MEEKPEITRLRFNAMYSCLGSRIWKLKFKEVAWTMQQEWFINATQQQPFLPEQALCSGSASDASEPSQQECAVC
ncbi:hypothetical protein [Sphingobacterium lactis]|uniref:hypothetical protein n=1 Tax=Sphingobacterium lactis TaxID=797291 RepID=UPI000CDEADC4|nr:hypothetical protein [Sphingobacterium lactis]